MRSVLITTLTVSVVLITACGGGGTGGGANAPTSGAAFATAAASPAAAVATNASPLAVIDDERSRAAATAIFHGVIDPACTSDHPVKAGFTCVLPRSTVATLGGGIAVFDVADPEAGDGYLGVLGRAPDSAWQYWFGTQQPYALLSLPGDMRVCADGDGLNLRSAPAAAASQVALLSDGTIVRGDGFVLTEPGDSRTDARKRGYGWYHIAAPQEGWAYSKYLSNAQIADCSLRDALERGAP